MAPQQMPSTCFVLLRCLAVVLATACFAPIERATAGVIFGFSDSQLGGGYRWDASPRSVGGDERSLVGGLRYSVQGGSMQAYRDLFSWNTIPSVSAFTTAVQQAFDAWSAVDPVSGLGTSLSFVPDLSTPVVGFNNGAGGLDTRGARSTCSVQIMRASGMSATPAPRAKPASARSTARSR